MTLMNVMCDIILFIVVVRVPNEISEILTDHFIQHVLLKIGIYYHVIFDYGSPFKGAFSAMCKALNINIDILEKIFIKTSLSKYFIRLLTRLSRLQQKIEERMMSLLLLALQQDMYGIVLQLIELIYFVVFLLLG